MNKSFFFCSNSSGSVGSWSWHQSWSADHSLVWSGNAQGGLFFCVWFFFFLFFGLCACVCSFCVFVCFLFLFVFFFALFFVVSSLIIIFQFVSLFLGWRLWNCSSVDSNQESDDERRYFLVWQRFGELTFFEKKEIYPLLVVHFSFSLSFFSDSFELTRRALPNSGTQIIDTKHVVVFFVFFFLFPPSLYACLLVI